MDSESQEEIDFLMSKYNYLEEFKICIENKEKLNKKMLEKATELIQKYLVEFI